MPNRILRPARHMMLLTGSIFLTEFLLMLFLRSWPAFSALERAFIDSFALIVVILPVLYFLAYRPIRKQMEARLAVETELRDRNRELDLFVKNVAHSLQSKLNPIVGAAWYLHDKYRSRLEEPDAHLLAVIERDGRKTMAVIADLLSLARLDENKVTRESLDVEEIVLEVVRKLDGELQGGRNAVVPGALPRVNLSRNLVTVALENLIRNAVRYGGKDGASVEVYGRKADGTIRLFVRDHGVGVPDKEREMIFDALYRGAGSKQLPGTGIGLALVRKIAGLYKGRVWVENTPGGGATFCLELRE